MLRKLLLYIEDSFYFFADFIDYGCPSYSITIGFLPLHFVSSVTKLRGNFLSDVNKVQHTKI